MTTQKNFQKIEDLKSKNNKEEKKEPLKIKGEIYEAKLQTEHLFDLSDILDIMEIDPNINPDGLSGDVTNVSLSIKVLPVIFSLIIRRLGKARNEIYNFLGSVYQKDVDKIKKIGFGNIIKLIVELKNNEEIASFFSSYEENQEQK